MPNFQDDRFPSVDSRLPADGMIIITGANRSGTSFTTNLLYELGLDLGPRELLLGADYRNPKGYFENKEILFTNISLLLGDWAGPRGWADEIEGRQPSWLKKGQMLIAKGRYFLTTPRDAAKRAAKKKPAIEALSFKYRNIAVNDARFSSTLGAWAKYTPIAKVLYCYRHPSDVVESMKRAYGLPTWAGYIFWSQRVTDFFHLADRIPLVMVKYNNFFCDGTSLAEMRRLYNFMQKEYIEGEARQTLGKVIEVDLKHHSSEDTTQLPRRVQHLYDMLNQYHTVYSELRPFQPIKPSPYGRKFFC